MNKKDSSIPETVGIIMDGNRRYAKEKGLPVAMGHRTGFNKLKEVLDWSKELGVKYVIAYALSTENWKRDKTEVGALLDLFRFAVKEAEKSLKKSVRQIRFIGEISRFPDDLAQSMLDAEKKIGDPNGIDLYLAVSYGGRGEIIDAIKKLNPEEKEELSEESFSKKLLTSSIPDPDIILRTGGEMRLSNFLLWQSAYSELFFVKTLWPAFTKDEFAGILEEYGRRKRNFGK